MFPPLVTLLLLLYIYIYSYPLNSPMAGSYISNFVAEGKPNQGRPAYSPKIIIKSDHQPQGVTKMNTDFPRYHPAPSTTTKNKWQQLLSSFSTDRPNVQRDAFILIVNLILLNCHFEIQSQILINNFIWINLSK